MKLGENANLMQYIKSFDYIGIVLYTDGLLLIMMDSIGVA